MYDVTPKDEACLFKLVRCIHNKRNVYDSKQADRLLTDTTRSVTVFFFAENSSLKLAFISSVYLFLLLAHPNTVFIHS